MALKLKAKKKVVRKTAPTNKKATPDKRKKVVKISDNYFDLSEYKYSREEVTLNRLRYNHIMYCDVKSCILVDGEVELEDSWLSLIVLMLDTIRVNYSDKFLDKLMEFGITTKHFCVDTKYGIYNFNEYQYKAYNLYNSGYYLEAIFNPDTIFWSIINMAKCLGIELDKMTLRVVNKNLEDIVLTELEEETNIVNVCDSAEYFVKGIHLVNINIQGTHTKVHHLEQVLYLFCNAIYSLYGDVGVSKLPKDGGTRVVKSEKLSNEPCMEIKCSGNFIYSDFDKNGVIKFITHSMNILGMNKEDVKLYFKKLKKKEEKKIWEVD